MSWNHGNHHKSNCPCSHYRMRRASTGLAVALLVVVEMGFSSSVLTVDGFLAVVYRRKISSISLIDVFDLFHCSVMIPQKLYQSIFVRHLHGHPQPAFCLPLSRCIMTLTPCLLITTKQTRCPSIFAPHYAFQGLYTWIAPPCPWQALLGDHRWVFLLQGEGPFSHSWGQDRWHPFLLASKILIVRSAPGGLIHRWALGSANPFRLVMPFAPLIHHDEFLPIC
mmetsp:Transcript_30792/g.74375  ORF Transcript_30792/g.74375 Transcript_30792/m.74375 type:complete len:223 (-) Transcript_30792:279-947(-)